MGNRSKTENNRKSEIKAIYMAFIFNLEENMTTYGIIRECENLCCFGILRNVKARNNKRIYQYFDDYTCKYLYIDILTTDKLVFNIMYETDINNRIHQNISVRAIEFHTCKDFRKWLADIIEKHISK